MSRTYSGITSSFYFEFHRQACGANQEWECFKADLLRGDIGIERIASSSHSEFLRFMRMHYQERYPSFLRLVLIILLVPIGSAECERMSILMNRLKTDLRSRMKNGRLNDLMTVNRLAPSIATARATPGT